MSQEHAPAPQTTPDSFHIALTGHRPSKLDGYRLETPFYRRLSLRLQILVLEQLLRHVHVTLHSGMALGADTVWAETVVLLRTKYPQRVSFIAEIPVLSQSDRWPSKLDRDRWSRLIGVADAQRVYADSYTGPQVLHARNEGMIDSADLLLAVWNGDEDGGTAAAVRYARRTSTPILVIAPSSI